MEGRQVASIDASREFDILRLVRSGQPDVILEDVLFETGSAELAAAASEAMDWLADRCLVNEGSGGEPPRSCRQPGRGAENEP